MADRGLIIVRELGPYLFIYLCIYSFTAVTKDAGGLVVIPFTVPALIDRKAFKGGRDVSEEPEAQLCTEPHTQIKKESHAQQHISC